jgi:N-acyl-D-aspartate/D-glutamate deacylase
MSHALVIRNGTVIDGTGKPGYEADVAIDGERIVAVGRDLGAAREEIDASGMLVTPGFVDIHTHYDGQVSWDEELTPSSLHGVTTCVMGNCGVGFAPVHAADRRQIIELMEGVEDIPGTALAEGIRWGWESFTEYMDAIDVPHAIDFAVQVPHDVLRVYVMRERAVAEEIASDDDIASMRGIVREALLAGAVGFSTGRTDNHRTAEGKPTPASEANDRELVGVARAFEGIPHGVLQVVSDFDMAVSPERFDQEFDLLEHMVEAAGGHPLSMSLMQRDQAPNQWRRILERAERADARGLTIRVQVAPRPIGVLLGLSATFHPFVGYPSYKAISGLPLADRAARMADPGFKARLLGERSERIAGDGSSVPPLADHLLATIEQVARRIFRFGEIPDYEPAPESCLWAEAQATGRTVLETLYDALLERNGEQLLYFPVYNYTEGSLENVRTMMTHPLALPGLSDGGAHVGTICDASMPTYLLTHWGRDRVSGRIPVERLVRMQTHDTARYIGLHDRGVVQPGARADLNVIDFERLQLRPPRIVADLPAGGSRLMQQADGFRATLVRGVVIAEHGSLTGARPGRLVRMSARD